VLGAGVGLGVLGAGGGFGKVIGLKTIGLGVPFKNEPGDCAQGDCWPRAGKTRAAVMSSAAIVVMYLARMIRLHFLGRAEG